MDAHPNAASNQHHSLVRYCVSPYQLDWPDEGVTRPLHKNRACTNRRRSPIIVRRGQNCCPMDASRMNGATRFAPRQAKQTRPCHAANSPRTPEGSPGQRSLTAKKMCIVYLAAFLSACSTGCQHPKVGPAQTNEQLEAAPDRSSDVANGEKQKHRKTDTARDHRKIEVRVLPRPDHWLVVKKAVNVEAGTWAKGDFNAGRNKISIVTKNVAEFTIDTDRIPIDWSRAVIISIDGINAELRHRDYSPLLFHREGYSSWFVVEP